MDSDTPAAAPVPSGKKVSAWLLEGIFIVVSVALGFAVTQYGDYRSDRALARQMLAGILTEVEYNRAALVPYVPVHQAWRDALIKVDSKTVRTSGLDLLFGTRPPLDAEMRANIPLLRHAAWDTATSTSGLRLIDYELAAGLSEIYSMQQHAAAAFAALFEQSAFYDSAAGVTTARLAQTAMSELTWAEETLLDLYDKHLPALRSASGGR